MRVSVFYFFAIFCLFNLSHCGGIETTTSHHLQYCHPTPRHHYRSLDSCTGLLIRPFAFCSWLTFNLSSTQHPDTITSILTLLQWLLVALRNKSVLFQWPSSFHISLFHSDLSLNNTSSVGFSSLTDQNSVPRESWPSVFLYPSAVFLIPLLSLPPLLNSLDHLWTLFSHLTVSSMRVSPAVPSTQPSTQHILNLPQVSVVSTWLPLGMESCKAPVHVLAFPVVTKQLHFSSKAQFVVSDTEKHKDWLFNFPAMLVWLKFKSTTRFWPRTDQIHSWTGQLPSLLSQGSVPVPCWNSH